MSDIDAGTLLQALLGADKQARESSPYSGFESIADSLSGSIIGAHKDAPGKLSLKDSLISSLVLGGIGGLANLGTESYVERQNNLAAQTLRQAITGNVFTKPEGMNPSIFNTVKTTGEVFGAQRALAEQAAARDAKLEIQKAIEKEKAIAPIALENKLAEQRGLLAEQRKYDPLAGLPDSTRKQVSDQKQQAAQNANTVEVVDALFAQAEKIPTVATFVPKSGANAQFDSIRVALLEAAQKLRGPEFNEPFRREIEKTLPDWNDTKAELAQKKASYELLLKGMTPVTPLVPGTSSVDRRAAALAELQRRGLVK